MSRLLLALAAAVVGTAALAQKSLEVKVGNPLRKQLLDVVRVRVEKEFRQKVKFKVGTLNADATWAFFGGEALQPNGKLVDLRTTRYKDDAEYMDGPSVYALMKKQGKTWRIVRYVVGPTDVAWSDWDAQTGAPPAVLGLNNKRE
jgi:hypothetical protein